MKIRLADLGEDPKDVAFTHPVEGLKARVDAVSGAGEVRFPKGIAVRASAYCSATQVHFDGRLDGESLRNCGRCLDDFVEPLQRRFRLVVVESGSSSDDPNDPGVDRHDGRELDAGALVEEQALLALEGTALCSQECRGLCPQCGVNRNREICSCAGPQ